MTEERLADRLLPDVSQIWMRDVLDAQLEAWPLDHDALRRQSDPMTCAALLLPHLFFDRGGLVWNDDWPEDKRRRTVRDLTIYKRLEGTPAGVEAYLNLEGGFLTGEELPPGNAFLMANETLDRAAVLELMPQLRFYHDPPARYEPWETAFWELGFWGEQYWTRDTASPIARYAVLRDRNVEIPLATDDVAIDDLTVRLHRPSEAGAASFWSSFAWGGASFFAEAVTHEPIAFQLADPQLERVRDIGAACFEEAFWGGAFASAFWGVQHWRAEDRSGTYERLYLWDPSRIPQHTSAASAGAFWGHFRYGVRDFYAYLEIAVPSAREALPGLQLFWGHGFWQPVDQGPLARMLLAMDAGRRGGDRLLVELAPTLAGAVMPGLPSLAALNSADLEANP